MRARYLLLCALFACAGGEDDDGTVVVPTRDGGTSVARDGGTAVVRDGGTAAARDGGTVEGFGTISGACDELDDELTSTTAATLRNAIDFGTDPYDDTDMDRLTEGGREIIRDGNAGGSSLLSEVFAYEVLARCEGAVLLKTETEIVYDDPMGKKTDLLVDIDGLEIGVSVTRAVGFPRDDPYPPMQARDLLTDKLMDIQDSTANVSAEDQWTKQILHVIAYAPGHADTVLAEHANLDPAVRADTVLVVTVTDGDDDFLY